MESGGESAATLWVAISGVVIGGFGVILSFVTAFLSNRRSKEQIEVASRQIRASVLSANRQAWINSFRERLAEAITRLEYLGLGSIRILAKMREQGGPLGVEERDRERREMATALQDAENRLVLVELMLNPEEKDHREIIQKLQLLENLVRIGKVEDSTEEIQKSCREAVTIGQKIIKQEWERAKAIE